MWVINITVDDQSQKSRFWALRALSVIAAALQWYQLTHEVWFPIYYHIVHKVQHSVFYGLNYTSSPGYVLFEEHLDLLPDMQYVTSYYGQLYQQQHPFSDLFSRTTWVSQHQKAEPFWILMKQEMVRWQWHKMDDMQIISSSLQT